MIAIDVAILPPPDISRRAIELSATLPRHESLGLLTRRRHAAAHHPHAAVRPALRRSTRCSMASGRRWRDGRRCRVTVTGAGRGGSAVWMAIEPNASTDGVASATAWMLCTLSSVRTAPRRRSSTGDARDGDVDWVAGFRRRSSYERVRSRTSRWGTRRRCRTVEPVAFDATTIAACHLGRYCTCRRVLRQWEL